MGVTGLWRLIDASGKPVPLESLEGKVLAIDISIWIHQVLQGYQDRRGNALPNAHLLGLYHRICKLLYFKIKPVFVFDGGVPLLKKNTIALRRKQKAVVAGKAEKMKNELLHNLMKHSLVKGILAKKTDENTNGPSTSSTLKSSKSVNDMFKLPDVPTQVDEYLSYESDSESDETSPRKHSKWKGNIHSVDVSSDDFKALPADVRYDILTDLKETRKQNSWAHLHEMPQESCQFSGFQMRRLLKRRQVQESLEAAEQEMGGKNLTLEELEKLMMEQGVDTRARDTAYRIASDDTTRMIYINDPKSLQVKRDDSGFSEDASQPGCSRNLETDELTVIPEEESVLENINEYDLDDDWDSDIEITDESIYSPAPKKFFGKVKKNPAFSYMMENSELSQEQILALIEQSKANVRNTKAEEKAKAKRSSAEREIAKNKVRKNLDSENALGDIKKEIHTTEEVSLDEQHEQVRPKVYAAAALPTESKLSSDSESDDFVEVDDMTIPPSKPEKKMEIVIKPDDKLDEYDMFADVFENEAENISADLSSNQGSVRVDELSSLPGKAQIKLNDSHTNVDKNVELNLHNGKVSETDDKSLADRSAPEEETKSNSENCENSVLKSENGISEFAKASTSTEENSLLDAGENSKSPENTAKSNVDFQPEYEEKAPVSARVNSIVSRLEMDKVELLKKANDEGELLDIKSQLETESEGLKDTIGKFERQSAEVTEQMRSDAQELLRLFGIPYVVAPQEAEAQCAYLETINLTDGTVTDDSDIWLFGGRCVYKNFFNNAKRVMQYLSKDIQHHFKLSREQMIQLALLVGSDYTVGISGIGPVTALEILASFPSEGDDLLGGLMKFSSWIHGGRVVGPGKATLRNKLKNVVVDRGFPSQAVVQAYLFPTVDESKETFTWGKPNIVLLTDYTREKFGWTKVKFEEIMGPVLKRLESKSQKDIVAYFQVKTVPKSIEQSLSKRVQKAVETMGKVPEESGENEVEDETKEGAPKKKKRRAVAKKKAEAKEEEKSEEVLVEGESADSVNDKQKKVKKLTKEVIPQREKDRENALKKKLQAIEVFRKSKKGPGKSAKKGIRPARNAIQKEAQLSESSSDSN